MIGRFEKLKEEIKKDEIDIGILIVSPDKLYLDWINSKENSTVSHMRKH